MMLKKLAIRNFCGFAALEVEFGPGVNIIAGLNGAGKTSLLKAAAMAAQQYWSARSFFSVQRSMQLEPHHVRRTCVKFKNGNRFEEQWPCSIEGWFEESGVDHSVKISAENGFNLKHPNQSFGPRISGDNGWPLLACYWTSRNWAAGKLPTAVEAASAKDSRRSAYAGALDASSGLPAFMAWMIGKTFERLQAIAVEKLDENDLLADELSILNKALAAALPGEFGSIVYDVKERDVIVTFADRSSVAFAALSDGERSFICLVADLVRRACLLNPQMGSDVLEETQGLVLIDELDLHLHPAWQRRIVQGLSKIFPKVQFIATTHSPQILGEVDAEQVRLLSNGMVESPSQSFGLTSDEILRNVMGTRDMNAAVSADVERIYELIDQEKYDEARRKLAAVQKRTKGGTEETVNLESLINTMDAQIED